MPGNYLAGEERFGPITSLLYNACARLRTTRDLYSFAARDLSRSRAKVLLDVGCGPAAIPIMLARRKDVKVYCVDPSPYMVRIAKGSAKRRANIRIAQGSSRNVPFRRKFDIIYTSLSFHHWQKKAESLAYLKGLLARAGEIRIYEYAKTNSRVLGLLGISAHTLDVDELRRAARDARLSVRAVAYSGRVVKVSLR